MQIEIYKTIELDLVVRRKETLKAFKNSKLETLWFIQKLNDPSRIDLDWHPGYIGILTVTSIDAVNIIVDGIEQVLDSFMPIKLNDDSKVSLTSMTKESSSISIVVIYLNSTFIDHSYRIIDSTVETKITLAPNNLIFVLNGSASVSSKDGVRYNLTLSDIVYNPASGTALIISRDKFKYLYIEITNKPSTTKQKLKQNPTNAFKLTDLDTSEFSHRRYIAPVIDQTALDIHPSSHYPTIKSTEFSLSNYPPNTRTHIWLEMSTTVLGDAIRIPLTIIQGSQPG